MPVALKTGPNRLVPTALAALCAAVLAVLPVQAETLSAADVVARVSTVGATGFSVGPVAGVNVVLGLDAGETPFVGGGVPSAGVRVAASAEVSEPALGMLVALGLGLLALSRRRLGRTGKPAPLIEKLTKGLFRSRL